MDVCDPVPFYQEIVTFLTESVLNSNCKFAVVYLHNYYFRQIQNARVHVATSQQCVCVELECCGGALVLKIQELLVLRDQLHLFLLTCGVQHSPVPRCLHQFFQNATVTGTNAALVFGGVS